MEEGAEDLRFTKMSFVDLAEYLQTRTVHKCTHKLKQRLWELNVSDEEHVQGLATADSSSVVLSDNRRIQAGWVQNVRQTLSLSAGRAFKIKILGQLLVSVQWKAIMQNYVCKDLLEVCKLLEVWKFRTDSVYYKWKLNLNVFYHVHIIWQN